MKQYENKMLLLFWELGVLTNKKSVRKTNGCMPKEERCKFTFRVALDLGQKCVCGYLSAPTNGERFT